MSITFLDLETTDLDPRKGQIWEVGVIRRRHGVDTEFLWQLAVDLDRADPRSLAVGQFHDRFVVPVGWEAARLDPATGQVQQRLTLAEAMSDFVRLWEWEDDRPVTHMVGAVPSFDDGYLKVLFAEHGARVCWHYHLVCAENLAAGCLGLEPPWDSDDLSRAMGVDPHRYVRHSAIGDCRLARDLYDAVMSRKMPGRPDLAQQEAERQVAATRYTIGGLRGTATVAHNGQGWTWACNRCEAVALLIDSAEEAERDARQHLKHDHEPQAAEAQQEVSGDA